jgi:hypothetical protein
MEPGSLPDASLRVPTELWANLRSRVSVGIAGREPARIAGVGAPIADIAYQKHVSLPHVEQFLWRRCWRRC